MIYRIERLLQMWFVIAVLTMAIVLFWGIARGEVHLPPFYHGFVNGAGYIGMVWFAFWVLTKIAWIVRYYRAWRMIGRFDRDFRSSMRALQGFDQGENRSQSGEGHDEAAP